MAQTIQLWGATYYNTPAVNLPTTNGTARFTDTTPTTAVETDVASGKIFMKADGSQATGTASGGGGIGTLLATKSLGTVQQTSTNATNLNQSVSFTGAYAYDGLIVETSVDTQTNNRHTATVRWILLTASSNVSTKNGSALATATWNSRLSSSGVTTTRSSTTVYGVYPNSVTISSDSGGTATIPMYARLNNTQTGTINGAYTVRVYGFKLYDMIGG